MAKSKKNLKLAEYSVIPLENQVSISESETVISHIGKEGTIVLSTNSQDLIKLMGTRKPDEVMHGQMVGFHFSINQTKWKKLLKVLAPDVESKPKVKRQGKPLSAEHLAKMQAGKKAKV